MNQRINKNMLIQSVAKKKNMQLSVVSDVCDGFLDEIVNVVSNGDTVSFSGFGTFALQTHKGHPIRFNDNTQRMKDYVVFRFVASNVLKQKFRNLHDNGELSLPTK